MRALWTSSVYKVTYARSKPRLALLTKSFSSTPYYKLTTTELFQSNKSSLGKIKINPDRLWDTIHSTAKWTEPKKVPNDDINTAGLTRLTLSNEDKLARDWFVETTKSLGCQVHVDQIGNIFAIRPGLRGENEDMSATFAGSHLDSQPSGGRFDGVLGIAAGIEMLRTLNDNWIETEGPVGVVNWTNEEGARYPISMMGSGVWSGRISLDDAWSTKSVSPGRPVTMVKQELERIGYLGASPASYNKGVRIGAHFELHIEQGPKLEKSGQKVGVVEGVQAYKWFTVTVTGREAHAGTTDMANRFDAMHTAAEFMVEARAITGAQPGGGGGGLVTFGRLTASPGSVNTIAGKVEMSLDMRSPSDQGLAKMVGKLYDLVDRLNSAATKNGKPLHPGLGVEIREDFSSAAVKFSTEAIGCVEESAAAVLGDGHGHGHGEKMMQRMTSGAGHDSVCTNMHCPTAMIFVPSKDGVSHNPSEWTDKEDCATGANVLLQSVLRMDKLRNDRGDFE